MPAGGKPGISPPPTVIFLKNKNLKKDGNKPNINIKNYFFYSSTLNALRQWFSNSFWFMAPCKT
jgi:hypothetical protein